MIVYNILAYRSISFDSANCFLMNDVQ